MVAAVVAYASFLGLGIGWTYAMLLPGIALLGFAFALALWAADDGGCGGCRSTGARAASGLLYTSMQFGMALGNISSHRAQRRRR
jgi:hypothetical protein